MKQKLLVVLCCVGAYVISAQEHSLAISAFGIIPCKNFNEIKFATANSMSEFLEGKNDKDKRCGAAPLRELQADAVRGLPALPLDLVGIIEDFAPSFKLTDVFPSDRRIINSVFCSSASTTLSMISKVPTGFAIDFVLGNKLELVIFEFALLWKRKGIAQDFLGQQCASVYQYILNRCIDHTSPVTVQFEQKWLLTKSDSLSVNYVNRGLFSTFSISRGSDKKERRINKNVCKFPYIQNYATAPFDSEFIEENVPESLRNKVDLPNSHSVAVLNVTVDISTFDQELKAVLTAQEFDSIYSKDNLNAQVKFMRGLLKKTTTDSSKKAVLQRAVLQRVIDKILNADTRLVAIGDKNGEVKVYSRNNQLRRLTASTENFYAQEKARKNTIKRARRKSWLKYLAFTSISLAATIVTVCTIISVRTYVTDGFSRCIAFFLRNRQKKIC